MGSHGPFRCGAARVVSSRMENARRSKARSNGIVLRSVSISQTLRRNAPLHARPARLSTRPAGAPLPEMSDGGRRRPGSTC